MAKRAIRLAAGRVGFFDPVTRIHLTLTNPGVELRPDTPITTAIINGIRGKGLIDVFGNILDEKGKVIEFLEDKPAPQKEIVQPKEEVKEIVEDAVVEAEAKQPSEEANKTTSTRGRKK